VARIILLVTPIRPQFQVPHSWNIVGKQIHNQATIGDQTSGIQLSEPYLPEGQDDTLENDGDDNDESSVYGIDRDV
jgi:hypothetical protein